MHTITYAGHTLTWEEHNAGDHTLIFIPGYSVTRTIWERDLAAFERLGRCVTLDLPGHYPAQVPHHYNWLTQETLLEVETIAIEQIAGSRPVTLIGHSTGGMVALAVAARRPDLVARVVCVSGVIWGPLTGVLGLLQQLLKRGGYPLFWLSYWLTQLSFRYMITTVANFYAYDGPTMLADQEAVASMRAWYPDYRHNRIRNLAVLLQMLEECDIRPLIKGMEVPTLLVMGMNDPVVPPEQARWAAEKLGCADLWMVPYAGHSPHWEARAAFYRAVTGWLERRPVQ